MLNENWMDDPSLKNMDPRKKNIIQTLMIQAKGKSLNQSVPLLLAAQNELSRQGLSFSPAERDVLFSILTAELTPQEKARFESMKGMMGGRSSF